MTTRRITISLPEDLMARVEQEPNASAYIADALRRRVNGETTRQALASVGVHVTDEGLTRARHRLAEADARRDPEGAAARLARRLKPFADAE